MKNKILILAMLLFSICSFAQNKIEYGFKAGINFSGFHTYDSAQTNSIGLNLGIMAELPLNDIFSLHGELLYNKRGGTKLYSYPTLGIINKLDYIDIPIQGKLYFSKKISIDFGGQIGFLIGENNYSENGTELPELNTKSVDFSANLGFSYKLESNFIVQARYNLGLTSVIKQEKFKNSMISISLGYFLN